MAIRFSGFRITCVLLLTLALSGCDAPTEPASNRDTFTDTGNPATTASQAAKPVVAQDAVASAHPLATDAGMEILANGGNAFDAAIAVAAVLGVVEPYSAGIGGGGFWLIHDAASNKNVMIDAREKAPLAAHRDLYLDEKGNVDRDKATQTPLAAGIPGQAAAFVHLADRYGKLPLSRSLAKAIHYAREGFPVDDIYLERARHKKAVFERYPESLNIFMNNGELKTGDTIVQSDLAGTLKAVADKGFGGFYEGPVARKLVEGVQAAGGIWTLEDLSGYSIVERAPISASYRNATMISASPPSSGGIAIAQMFLMLKDLRVEAAEPITKTHLLVEVMRRAYRDRAEHLGDPDFHDVPFETLLNPRYNQSLVDNLSHNHATPSSDLPPAVPVSSGDNTTHLSILDRHGNYVSATLSINTSFGSGFTVPGTGVLLNNEMDDFSAKPGAPNAYGLVGNEANAIEPGKRPLSSMTPSFLEITTDEGKQIAILGTPGGSRIISMVFLGMLEAIDGKPPEDWVSRPRFHHQYLPDTLFFEKDAFTEQEQLQLAAMGHNLKELDRQYGNMQAILWHQKSGKVQAASDPRNIGKASVRGADANASTTQQN
ncbi:MAG: gamma-glutamyltransferase [Ketobacteraceae bacterium]|nr:gamma-glutamyltransferase [Ketobacteraceae bacterium]